MRDDFYATLTIPSFLLLVLVCLPCASQTTQGLITGQVLDAGTKNPISKATVEYFRREPGGVVETRSVHTNEQGFYAFSFVPPGVYQLRVCQDDCASWQKTIPATSEYQPQEIYELELFVASRLEVNFAMRKLTDAWKVGIEKGLYEDSTTAIIHFYAADVGQLRSAYLQLVPAQTGPLEATISYVIDPKSVQNLPLSGRDIYSTLVLQPGVTSNSTTTRGLGLSANGQRPTSSNFLLDGVENNNYFQTGPLTPISPEAMQEYRISTSNYSAEYGRTSGFLANAVTHSGTNSDHGLLFGYLGNEWLNANSFQNNANQLTRVPYKELHAGYGIGGPILRNRLFFFSEFEQFRSRTQQNVQNVCLPVLSEIAALNQTPDTNIALRLLTKFPITATSIGSVCGSILSSSGVRRPVSETYQWSPTVSIDRSLALERFDYVSPKASDRWIGRIISSRASRPDFVTTPYKGLNSRLSADSTGIVLGYTHNFKSNVTNELRLGWTNYDLHWNRPASDVPILYNNTGQPLPSSSLPYAFANRENYWEVGDDLSLIRGRHIFTAGGGLLIRRPHSLLTELRDGAFFFSDTSSFVLGRFLAFNAAVQQGITGAPVAPYVEPTFSRSYSNQQFHVFLQDTWHWTSRLSVNAGLRFESLGALKNVGSQDFYIDSEPGNSIPAWYAALSTFDQARTYKFIDDPNRQRSWYSPDRTGWAPRLGISYLLRRTLLHAAYGIYYDRPFDNLLGNTRLNNISVLLEANNTTLPMTDLSSPLQIINNGYPSSHLRINLAPILSTSEIVAIDPNLRNARVQSWFAGIQQPLSSNWTLEINYLGSSGQHLLTSDQLNRQDITPNGLTYIGNQGYSSYEALASVVRYRARSAQLQFVYTLSHSIDVQSDPLVGGLDLGSATVSGSGSSTSIGTSCSASIFGRRCSSPNKFSYFSVRGNPLADRGNSDFDQRHNLIFTFVWQLPAPQTFAWMRNVLNRWQVAGVGAFRSGFPINVTGIPGIIMTSTQSNFALRNRPNLTGRAVKNPSPEEVIGGLKILNDKDNYTDAFAPPPPEGMRGQLGRNAIPGPGFWNVDLSVARSFHLFGGETRVLQFRVDLFNALNHANLGPPDGDLNSRTFGQSFYGETAPSTGFTTIVPLAAEQRQIQLQVKFLF